MRFGSVCSGIEAASVAFGPLGWHAAWLAEIEPFPCAVLAHHYPQTPNLGDMTLIADRIDSGDIEAPDLLCGGCPCQSFSVAGLRKSLSDDRGNLTLEFIRIADAIDRVRRDHGKSPAWVLYENVPGILSTEDNAFGAFLGGLCGGDTPLDAPEDGWPSAGVVAGPGRVVAWRCLDAQFFGLAQRRKRVFVLALAGAGGWGCADALLPITDSLSGHPAPSREARQEPAIGALAGTSPGGGWRVGADEAAAGHAVAATLDASFGHLQGASGQDVNHGRSHLVSMCLNAKGGGGRLDAESETLIPTIGGGFDVAPVAFGWQNSAAQGVSASEHHSPTLDKSKTPAVGIGSAVRRLTPMECERLQGFPDGFTAVPHRGKPAADGPRYKALGNSWAVPCVRWIGRRIDAVSATQRITEAA
jgi:DNA (cytosine-5)-methyltransferase 1